jgi:hypothetical protein
MPAEHDKFWKEVQGKLRRALDLHPLCQEESEKEYKKAKAEPLSEQDVDDVLEFVRSMGERGGMPAPPEDAEADDEDQEGSPPKWVDPVSAEMVDEEMLQLNRNAGDKDDETQDLIEKHRREALGDDIADENTNGPKDEDNPRLEDGENPSGTRK